MPTTTSQKDGMILINIPAFDNSNRIDHLPDQVSKQDGMIMVNIPAGEFWMGDENPQNLYLSEYWIDQKEVTNEMYQKCVEAGGCEIPREVSSLFADPYFGNKDYADTPAIFIDQPQADAYCSWVGERLPTEAEWEKAARGIDGRQYPWGNVHPVVSPQVFIANDSETLFDTSPYGVRNMVTGVSEWTSSIYPEFNIGNVNSNFVYDSDIAIIKGSVGGRNIGPVYYRTGLPIDRYSDELGFRCASDSMPTGNFEPTPTKYTFDDFWIARTEVTNSMFKKCVSSGSCTPLLDTSSFTRDNYYDSPEFNDYPVINVTWLQALDYCSWVGGRLPTEEEWIKAAQGVDERFYPWGDEKNQTYANYNNSIGDTTRVGSYPAGVSPFGVLDMAGNVWEMTTGYFDPNGPSTVRVVLGGSWDYSEASVFTRSDLGETQLCSSCGFRCVFDYP